MSGDDGLMDRARTAVCNVLAIGSGAAGMRAAIAAHEVGAHVAVVDKRPRLDAHTVLASGGINGALGTRDLEVNFYARLTDGRLTVRGEPVPEPPPELAALTRTAPRVEAGADRLFE